MSIYLIDYENVNLSGLSGIETLSPMDRVYLFYGANSGYIPFEKHILIAKSPAEVTYLRVDRSGKNYLDFQLATYSGYLVAMYSESEYIIVSRDTGFDSIVNFWNRDPEGRGVHFSRREAIVPPVPARPAPAPVRAPIPSASAPEQTYVPTRRAPIPPVITPAADAAAASVSAPIALPEQTYEEAPRDSRNRNNRRRGRGGHSRRTTQPIESTGVLQTLSEQPTVTEPTPAATVYVPENSIPDPVEPMIPTEEAVVEAEAPEVLLGTEAEIVTESVTEIDAQTSGESADDTLEIAAESEEEHAESSFEESAESSGEESADDQKPEEAPIEPASAWGKLPTSVASSGNIGVYVPGTAASGKAMPKLPFLVTAQEKEEPTEQSAEEASTLPEQTLAEALSEQIPAWTTEEETTEKEEAAAEIVEEPVIEAEASVQEVPAEEAPVSEATAEQAPVSEATAEQEAPTQEGTPVEVVEAQSDVASSHSARRRNRRSGDRMKSAKPAPEAPSSAQSEQPEAEQKDQQPDTQPRLPERFKSRVREAVKEEGLNSGGYTQIYNRILKCDNKSRFNNELVKAFSQEKGSRIYKLVLSVYEEYRKSLSEAN